MEVSYEVPKWAGIPPAGFHLDVMKENKLFQKLMIDEKSYYLFGRNVNLTDFCIDHASCSRVHAALVYHKHLERFFLVDLGSTHGSHIGNVRLEAEKPTQLPINSNFHFGASTRVYILREKPKTKGDLNEEEGSTSTLPESEFEVDNLTEYNTAHNRRISMLGIPETENLKPATAKKRKAVSFSEDEDIINPEDIDPSVGKFRNLVQTSIVPSVSSKLKRIRTENNSQNLFYSMFHNRSYPQSISSKSSCDESSCSSSSLLLKSSQTCISLPNPAPDVDILENKLPCSSENLSLYDASDFGLETCPSNEDKKKKYAKEAWPGRKNCMLSNF